MVGLTWAGAASLPGRESRPAAGLQRVGSLFANAKGSLPVPQSEPSIATSKPTMSKPTLLILACTALLLTPAAHAAAKPCDELKAEIAAKLDEKGVKGYEIAVVENDKVGDAKVIGSCDGGTKKLTYLRK